MLILSLYNMVTHLYFCKRNSDYKRANAVARAVRKILFENGARFTNQQRNGSNRNK